MVELQLATHGEGLALVAPRRPDLEVGCQGRWLGHLAHGFQVDIGAIRGPVAVAADDHHRAGAGEGDVRGAVGTACCELTHGRIPGMISRGS